MSSDPHITQLSGEAGALANYVRTELNGVIRERMTIPLPPGDRAESSAATELDPAVSGPLDAAHTSALLVDDSAVLLRLGRKQLLVRLPYNGIEFSPFLAESLLRDGSHLLDRCLLLRKEYHELAVRWLEARIQIDEFNQLNEITIAEEQALYPLPAEIARQEKLSAEQEREMHSGAAVHVTQAKEYTARHEAELIARRTAAAFAAAHDVNGGRAIGPWPPMHVPNSDARGIVGEGAKKSAEHEVHNEIRGLRAQERLQQGAADAAAAREQRAEVSRQYEELKARFARRRNDVARHVALRRAAALTNEDGELNYGAQMQPLRERFSLDLAAAWHRLRAAADGLRTLYNYTNRFPTVSGNNTIDFDELVTWTQIATAWAAAFHDRQQIATRSFSLRSLVGDRAFSNARRTGVWRFRLDPSHFEGRRLVRLRGFAAQIHSNRPFGSWNLVLQPPDRGRLRLENGTERDLDQSVGELLLGRVAERTFAVVSEGTNAPRLQNVSPIGVDGAQGEWKLRVIGASTAGTPVDDIADFDMHLHVAML